MDEYMGEEYGYDAELVENDEILGAVRAPAFRRGGAVRAPARVAPQQARQLATPMITARARAPYKVRGYLGMGVVTFVNAGVTQQSLTVEPQRKFRPERLIIARKNVGAASPALQCNVDSLFIGDIPQSPSVEAGAPTEMFEPDATVSGIDCDIASPGMKIRLTLSISAAPAVGETVSLACGFYGDMPRE